MIPTDSSINSTGRSMLFVVRRCELLLPDAPKEVLGEDDEIPTMMMLSIYFVFPRFILYRVYHEGNPKTFKKKLRATTIPYLWMSRSHHGAKAKF